MQNDSRSAMLRELESLLDASPCVGTRLKRLALADPDIDIHPTRRLNDLRKKVSQSISGFIQRLAHLDSEALRKCLPAIRFRGEGELRAYLLGSGLVGELLGLALENS
jgi:hypothetical protein